MVVSIAGEVPLALTTYHFTAEQLRAGGAPVATAMAAPGVMACNDLPSLRMTLARETARS